MKIKDKKNEEIVIKKAANVIIKLNEYRENKINNTELISIVSEYFDLIKKENLFPADLKFLQYISNSAGVPHYFDILKNGKPEIFKKDYYKKLPEIKD